MWAWVAVLLYGCEIQNRSRIFLLTHYTLWWCFLAVLPNLRFTIKSFFIPLNCFISILRLSFFLSIKFHILLIKLGSWEYLVFKPDQLKSMFKSVEGLQTEVEVMLFLGSLAMSSAEVSKKDGHTTMYSSSSRSKTQRYIVRTPDLSNRIKFLTQMKFPGLVGVWSAPACTSETVLSWVRRMSKRKFRAENNKLTWTLFVLINQWVRSPFRVMSPPSNLRGQLQRVALSAPQTQRSWCRWKWTPLKKSQTLPIRSLSKLTLPSS